MRSLMTYTPRPLASDLFNEMDKFFGAFAVPESQDFLPACEVSENEELYRLSFDLPGMKKDEIKIEWDRNLLSISGERKRSTSTPKEAKVQRVEKSYGFFKRSFQLPRSIDADRIEAHYADGVLELTIPKSAEAKARTIEIKGENPSTQTAN